MADTAAHLVDRVFPEAPVRQYVVSLPFALRYGLAFDQKLCSEVLHIFMQTVFSSLKRRARKIFQMREVYCGAVTFLQRSGGSINLNPHFYSLILDGVYFASVSYEAPRFYPLPPPTDAEIARTTAAIARRVGKLLVRRGPVGDDGPTDPDPLEADESLLSQLYSASVKSRIATDHLSELPDGRILHRLRHRWRDGTTHVVFEPFDLVGRLAALVPPPCANIVRYHGFLAPCAQYGVELRRDWEEIPPALPGPRGKFT